MYGITETVKYGDYKFDIGFDSGSETGLNQLLVDVAEKLDPDTAPLSEFSLEELLQALKEPEQTRLRIQLEQQRATCAEPFDNNIAEIERRFPGKVESLPRNVRKHMKELRRQKREAIQQLEGRFLRQECFTLDTGRFDKDLLRRATKRFGESRHLRDFYFEEANDYHIHNFCRKFAFESDYRQAVLEGHAPWIARNELFARNLPAQTRDLPSINLTRAQQMANDQQVRNFFKWIDAHAQKIIALPEYQRLEALDNAFNPNASELDPYIKPAVELLNQIPGVVTRFSCQGVSGKVHFEGYDLLAVSHHQEYASISFQTLESQAYKRLTKLLPEFPAVSLVGGGNFTVWELRSTGDNLRFRKEVVALAKRALEP